MCSTHFSWIDVAGWKGFVGGEVSITLFEGLLSRWAIVDTFYNLWADNRACRKMVIHQKPNPHFHYYQLLTQNSTSENITVRFLKVFEMIGTRGVSLQLQTYGLTFRHDSFTADHVPKEVCL